MAAQLPIHDIAYESSDSEYCILYIIDRRIRKEFISMMDIPYASNADTFAFYWSTPQGAAEAHPDFYSIHMDLPVEIIVLISAYKELFTEKLNELSGLKPVFVPKIEFTEAMYEASRYYVFNSDD